MEALETERREMERKFTIHQHDVEKLKEAEVLSKYIALNDQTSIATDPGGRYNVRNFFKK